MPSLGFNANRLSPRAAEHRVESTHNRMRGEFGSTKAPLATESPEEVGRFREFWAARPGLSVAVMFLTPVVLLLLFSAVT